MCRSHRHGILGTMLNARKQHWDAVYTAKPTDRVSWYRPHLDRSLRFIEDARLPKDAAILDVGGGAATLVDDLLDLGYLNMTVLDLSEAALRAAQRRLGERAARVTWLCADVLEATLPEHGIDFWHDRAVFHFLTEPAARARYVEQVRRALRPGGHIVIATFGPGGPEKCSGLPVARFTAAGIHSEFGADFAKVGDAEEAHQTPWGSDQAFVYCYCRMPGRQPMDLSEAAKKAWESIRGAYIEKGAPGMKLWWFLRNEGEDHALEELRQHGLIRASRIGSPAKRHWHLTALGAQLALKSERHPSEEDEAEPR